MTRNLKRAVGGFIGVFYLAVATLAFRTAAAGLDASYPDLGFWWGVIGALLATAGLAALVGTWLHTR